MGNEFSEPVQVLQAHLDRELREREAQRQHDQALFRALDARTKVPHLLIELRSLGFVEICGKDTGGIYRRLDEWLRANWGCAAVTHEARDAVNTGCSQCCRYQHECTDFCCSIPFSDYLLCGCHLCSCGCRCCSNEGTLSLMEQQPLHECDRLCDANYSVPTQHIGSLCGCLSLMECDRHYPVTCWYSARCCCAKCIPRPAIFRRRGWNGENNMGKLTMQLVNFMTNECGWSLALCNGTNLGFHGDIREQQIKFAAPHPLNLIAPHLMVELRMAGYVEVNGPDTDGIHGRLQEWLMQAWSARRIRADPEFCDAKLSCSAFQRRGMEGENNMGLRTMELVDFMVKTCSWTLIACNGGNFGRFGDLREQQLVFRNDAHVQHGMDHIMVELRDLDSWSSAGYIEVNGIVSSPDIEKPLDDFLKHNWHCRDYEPPFLGKTAKPFCERKYSVPEQFYYRSQDLTNNLGKRTIELSQFLASQGWLLTLCNGGAVTTMRGMANRMKARSVTFPVGGEFRSQIKREQQIKFTKAREGERADAPLLMIELRAVPRDPDVENVPFCIGPRWQGLCENGYQNKSMAWSSQTADRRFTRREEVHKWLKADCTSPMKHDSRGAMSRDDCDFPAYHEPSWRAAARAEKSACAIIRGLIEVNGPDTNGIYRKLQDFVVNHMGGRRLGQGLAYCDLLFSSRVFRMKKVPFPTTVPEYDGYYLGENNFGVYTMRLCDFLVDHLGEWDLIVCNGNVLERAWKVDRDRAVSIAAREQQLVFRHRQGRRNVFMSSQAQVAAMGRPPLDAPAYWREGSRQGKSAQELVPVAAEELRSLQDLLDGTHERKATRDRKSALADRFVAVSALRSEHPALWDRYVGRRREVLEAGRDKAAFVVPRTMAAAPELACQCRDLSDSTGGDPVNQAYLMHGTNPTSALAILRTSFKIDFAGGASGTMFGAGVYLAEASSKADEYAQDDSEGAYKGLYAMLVCRAVVGRAFETEEPGDYAGRVTSGDFDCVLGDREKAVGTYREFIFHHEGSVYPEFVVFYRREFGEGGGPSMGGAPAAQVYGRGAGGGGGGGRGGGHQGSPAPPARPTLPGTVAAAPHQHSMKP